MLRKPILHGAVCSNGTDFNQLDPNGLNNCTFILDVSLKLIFTLPTK